MNIKTFSLFDKADWGIAFGLVGALLLLPLLISFSYIGDRVIFNLFAGDSMYYMALANNFVKFGFITFDGETASNGFHPLWEFLLMALFKISALKHHNQIYAVFGLSVAFVYAAYVILSYILLRLFGKYAGAVGTIALIPGIYELFLEPRRTNYGEPGLLYSVSPYSAMNGMETPLSLLLWALFFLSFMHRFSALQQKPKSVSDISLFFPLSARLCLAALSLARLDDFIFVGAIGFLILLRKNIALPERARMILHITWPACTALCLYAAFNFWTVGTLLPTSATHKVEAAFAALANINYIGSVFSGQQGDVWWVLAVRIFPLMFALCAGALLCWASFENKKLNGLTFLVRSAAVFLVAKALFLIIFVHAFHQGYWYYFSMICICNLVFAFMVSRFVAAHTKHTKIFACASILIFLFFIPNHINLMARSGVSNYGEISYQLWNNDEKIRNFLLAKAPKNKLIDSGDGAFSYLLDMPAESITGLPSNPQELQKRKNGMWQSFLLRGFTLMPNYGYFSLQDLKNSAKITEEIHPPFSPISFFRIEPLPPKR